mmetsp:Transcript_91363/g.258048  ORF Transcript_91363/g.258048 Transcript_91363/m.258048 type:complete len:892 (-) Transcript_91363:132-2807(-)
MGNVESLRFAAEDAADDRRAPNCRKGIAGDAHVPDIRDLDTCEAHVHKLVTRHSKLLEGWDNGGALCMRSLARELALGLCDLKVEDGNLVRSVSVVEVSIVVQHPEANRSMVLVEETQLLGGGCRRPRGRRPHVKLFRDEAPKSGVSRALHERLGVDPEALPDLFSVDSLSPIGTEPEMGWNLDFEPPRIVEATSSSYPGLFTRYKINSTTLWLRKTDDMELNSDIDDGDRAMFGMPHGSPFMTVESDISMRRDGNAGQQCVHLWQWVQAAGAAYEAAAPRRSALRRSVTDLSARWVPPKAEIGEELPGMDQAHRDIETVLRTLEAHKASLERSGNAEVVTFVEGRLHAVLDRFSDSGRVVRADVERKLKERRLSRDLRHFISKNFDNGCIAELSPEIRPKERRLPTWAHSADSSAQASTKSAINLRSLSDKVPSRRRHSSSSESSQDLPRTKSCVKPRTSLNSEVEAGTGRKRVHIEDSQDEHGDESQPGDRDRRQSVASDRDSAAGDYAESDGSPPPEFSECATEAARLRSSGNDQNWVLDVLALHERMRRRALVTVGELLLVPHAAELGTGEATMRRFIHTLHNRYEENPNSFHNEAHASIVCHSTHWLAVRGRAWAGTPPWERVATDVAALAHDVGHFGRNNMFCVNTGHEMAQRYNDRSVLENLHAATCFQLMEAPDRNILRDCSQERRRSFRDHVIDLILATDMTSHFDFLGRFRIRASSADFAPEANAKDRQLVTQCYVKAADLGHAALPWEMHERWALRLLAEFYEQGDEERNLGLSVSPMCERSGNVNEFRESQKGFLQFVILPLFKELAIVTCPEVNEVCIVRIEANAETWVSEEPSKELIAIVEGSTKAVSPSGSPSSASGRSRRYLRPMHVEGSDDSDG